MYIENTDVENSIEILLFIQLTQFVHIVMMNFYFLQMIVAHHLNQENLKVHNIDTLVWNRLQHLPVVALCDSDREYFSKFLVFWQVESGDLRLRTLHSIVDVVGYVLHPFHVEHPEIYIAKGVWLFRILIFR